MINFCCKFQESQDLYSLTSLCLLSHHPLFSSFRTCLFYLKSLIDSCNKKINRSRKEGHKRYILK